MDCIHLLQYVWGVYSLCRWRWPLYNFFCHLITVRMEIKPSSPTRGISLCACEKSWCILTDGAVFRLEKMFIWIALWIEGLYMDFLCISQHCSEFWGWAVDRFKPNTKMCISSLFVVKNNFRLENLNVDETPTAALYVEWDYLSNFAVQYIDTLAT